MIYLIDDDQDTLTPTRERLDDLGIDFTDGPAVEAGGIVIVAGDAKVETTEGVVVLRVPVGATPEAGVEALRRASEEPGATLAVGRAGAVNAALLAARILASRGDVRLRAGMERFAAEQRDRVLADPDPASPPDS